MTLVKSTHFYNLKLKIEETERTRSWLATLNYRGSQKDVILRTIFPTPDDTPEFENLLKNDAHTALKIRHPNIAALLDFGSFSPEKYFIASEYIHGFTLHHIVQRLQNAQLRVPPWFPLHCVLSVCNALEYAHNLHDEHGTPLGIIHRFVNPRHIVMSFYGTVKVFNLGLSNITSYAYGNEAMKFHNQLAYTPPELLRGDAVSCQGDIYSLGVILYEMLTGQLPYTATTPAELVQTIESTPPLLPSKLSPWIPGQLDTVIMRALSPDFTRRHVSAYELAKDITRIILRNDFARCKEELGLFMCAVFSDNPNIPASIKKHLTDREQIVTKLTTRGKQRWEWLDYIKAPSAQMLEPDNGKGAHQQQIQVNDSTAAATQTADDSDPDIDDDTREIDIKEVKAKIAEEDRAQENSADPVSSETKLITITPPLPKRTESKEKPSKKKPPKPVTKAAPTGTEEPDLESELMAIAIEESEEKETEREQPFRWPTNGARAKENGQQAADMGELWNTFVSRRESWVETASGRNIAAYFNTPTVGPAEYEGGETMAIPTLKSLREGKSIPFGDLASPPQGEQPHPVPPTLSPENSEGAVHFDKGLEALRAKKYTEALTHFEAACEADPDNKLYRINFKRLTILVNGKEM